MRFDAPHPWGAPCRRPTDVPIRSRRICEEAYQGWIVRRLIQEEAAQLPGGCVPGPSDVTSTVMRTPGWNVKHYHAWRDTMHRDC